MLLMFFERWLICHCVFFVYVVVRIQLRRRRRHHHQT